MGLDIYYVSHIKRSKSQTITSPNKIHIHVDPSFKEQADHLQDGVYLTTDKSIDASFRAGSYSGYDAWRRELSTMALGVVPNDIWDAPNTFHGKPFYELINFPDNEGCIGPKTSGCLYKAFTKHIKKATTHTTGMASKEDAIYFMETYNNFMEAFKTASQDGVVIFC